MVMKKYGAPIWILASVIAGFYGLLGYDFVSHLGPTFDVVIVWGLFLTAIWILAGLLALRIHHSMLAAVGVSALFFVTQIPTAIYMSLLLNCDYTRYCGL